jgi:hypothetical protein
MKDEIKGNRNCLECGIEFNCEIDNPLCLCDNCYKEKMLAEDK